MNTNKERYRCILDKFEKDVIKAAKGKWNRKYDANECRIYVVAGAYSGYIMYMSHNYWYGNGEVGYLNEYCDRMLELYRNKYPDVRLGDIVKDDSTQRRNHHLGNCAEQHACNRVLLADERLKVNDVHFTKAFRVRTAQVVEYCEICKNLFSI